MVNKVWVCPFLRRLLVVTVVSACGVLALAGKARAEICDDVTLSFRGQSIAGSSITLGVGGDFNTATCPQGGKSGCRYLLDERGGLGTNIGFIIDRAQFPQSLPVEVTQKPLVSDFRTLLDPGVMKSGERFRLKTGYRSSGLVTIDYRLIDSMGTIKARGALRLGGKVLIVGGAPPSNGNLMDGTLIGTRNHLFGVYSLARGGTVYRFIARRVYAASGTDSIRFTKRVVGTHQAVRCVV